MERSVSIQSGTAELQGDLVVPMEARGLVLFAHGSGSSRHSPRNRAVAGALRAAGLGTLLVDLLSLEEEAAELRAAHLRFDVELLAERLLDALQWLQQEPSTSRLRLGLFGASTGAAAALVAAGRCRDAVAAIVARGGRPDLAVPALPQVRAPTLFIVGGADAAVIELNRAALARLGALAKELIVIPGATHLFEEPGALEEVARLSGDWFARWLAAPAVVERKSR